MGGNPPKSLVFCQPNPTQQILHFVPSQSLVQASTWSYSTFHWKCLLPNVTWVWCATAVTIDDWQFKKKILKRFTFAYPLIPLGIPLAPRLPILKVLLFLFLLRSLVTLNIFEIIDTLLFQQSFSPKFLRSKESFWRVRLAGRSLEEWQRQVSARLPLANLVCSSLLAAPTPLSDLYFDSRAFYLLKKLNPLNFDFRSN